MAGNAIPFIGEKYPLLRLGYPQALNRGARIRGLMLKLPGGCLQFRYHSCKCVRLVQLDIQACFILEYHSVPLEKERHLHQYNYYSAQIQLCGLRNLAVFYTDSPSITIFCSMFFLGGGLNCRHGPEFKSAKIHTEGL
jgi:hypothetical protein